MSSLGRGLESLIPPDDGGKTGDTDQTLPVVSEPLKPPVRSLPPTPPKSKKIFDSEAVFQIEIEKIKPNPDQPRRHFDEAALRELASSIREYGVLQPIIVSKIQHDTDDGSEVEYQLIAGERRLMAASMAGLPRIPAIIRSLGARREQLELAILENIQREDLTPIETARAFARLQDEFALTQREIAMKLGKSRESVANTLRLLNLPTSIQRALEEGKINESQGRLLLGVSDIQSQEQLFQELMRDSLSVRELRSRLRTIGGKSSKTAATESVPNPELLEVKSRLELFFGAPVRVQQNGDTGKIVISFYSPEELDNIMSRLEETRGVSADANDDSSFAKASEDESDEFVV
ncbi:MAG: ParB/RepB/Spo0J family partition protein [bacterium]|nr:ParB/RepB/Spo0J family partition protein [bacterium]